MGFQKPRKLPAHLVWARDNKELVKTICDIAKSDEGVSATPTTEINASISEKLTTLKDPETSAGSETKRGKRKGNRAVVDYQAAVKSGFEDLPKSEREKWEKKAEAEIKEALQKRTDIISGPPSTKPEDLQR